MGWISLNILKKTTIMDEIIQLKITLDGTNPPIWRRILVNKQTTFFELHHIIQIVMGWENCHLYEFNLKKKRIGETGIKFDGFNSTSLLNANEVRLEDLITGTKDKFTYLYDFGDSWSHAIVVEKILPIENQVMYPKCIGGELNCPPEDCGGIYGFYDLLEIIGDKKHPERKEMIEWLGSKYDPKYFNEVEINKRFKKMTQILKKL